MWFQTCWVNLKQNVNKGVNISVSREGQREDPFKKWENNILEISDKKRTGKAAPLIKRVLYPGMQLLFEGLPFENCCPCGFITDNEIEGRKRKYFTKEQVELQSEQSSLILLRKERIKFCQYYLVTLRCSTVGPCPEPYQPRSIPPNWGGPRCHRRPKIQSRRHLAPQRKLRSPN